MEIDYIMGKLWTKNEVKVDIASYMHYIRGQKKVGKTTLFNDLVSYIGKGDMENGLLISVGDEQGYKTLDGLIVANAKSWDDFVEIVDELVENPTENDFKFIAIDTVDELFHIATEEVFRIHKKKKGEKCESLNSALGGYGAGRAKLKELVREQIARLKESYGLFCIGHTKLRDITEKGSGEAYQQLTTSLNFDYDSVIADKADIIATISVDKDIVDVEEIDMGKGKTKKVGSIGGVTRWIHFRDDNFNVDCGARFGNIVDKVELSAENYINAIEDAIKKSAHKSDEELVVAKKKEIKEREEKALKQAEELSSVNPQRNLKLAEQIKELYGEATKEQKALVKELMVEYNITSFAPEHLGEVKTEGLEKIVEVLA